MKELQREFISLLVEEKVSRVNTSLKSKDLRQAAFEVTGCSATWLRGHMESLGYQYSRTLGQYIEVGAVKPRKADRDDFAAVRELLEVKDQLLTLVGSQQQPLEISRSLYEQGEAVTRSMKTYAGVFEAFDVLCDTEYPQYRKQDLLGVALLEFVRKYGKELMN